MRTLAAIALLCAMFAGCGGACRSLAPPVVDGRMLPAPIACHGTYTGRCCVWESHDCLHQFCDSRFSCEWEYRSGIRIRGAGACEVPVGYVLLTVKRPPVVRALNQPRPASGDGAW